MTNQETKLTARETEALQNLANGMKPHECAEAMGISKRTVDFYQNHIYQKLGVQTLMKAVVKARKEGGIV